MKKLLCMPLLLMFGGVALGQTTNVPPCNANASPAITTNCTDYFAVGNYANSPLPAGTITGFTLIAGGSGYANPLVLITDPAGSGASATATADSSGVITLVTVSGGGSGYILPQVNIVDVGSLGTLGAPTCGGPSQPACGSGALATALIGAPFTGGMLKFQDALPDLKLLIATADTTTFPGSDFYVIGLQQYTQQMHSSLGATTLRGYCQLANASATACSPSYLGPVIVAQKNKPVRVLFKNLLPPGTGGDLFIPVDTTYMGAGAPYTQNRATLHLHGGATPWISDGTPHQWTVPAAEGSEKGLSTAFVPDMWFDPATHTLVPAGTPGAVNDPGPGAMTFFWTNQQGGRLMFYHDHAYGITRLNVYAGEAAGYLLYDPTEEAALAAATAPGTITANADLAHLIPLVIQDKTFVPSAAQLAAQDPTWTVGNFGTNPGFVNNGDLWFPHVYMTNQNPADPNTANGFGRWDYGPWFFPPQTSLTAGAITIPCTSAAFPPVPPATTPPTLQCPITPNPSGTPESFMDTPVVNGKAYPVLHVAPAAYRFQILSAGNDRSLNLSWFVADATQNNTEVAMLPAAPPPANGLPLCGSINPVAVPSLVLGMVSALLDGGGNPLNGTGLPAGCWPNYGPALGIPAPQTMWAADGRAGGAPDPRKAGPPWIQIGSEGGLLPTPVVIPATPINYEQNTRSITIGSVAMHGLWLGPAERADVIVDFSKFAGQTLILYNDAPTPAPAFDSRLDYFTGDGDQSPIGGAPNTPPGYGPNTRTVMQVVVDGNAPNSQPFSLAALRSAFASTGGTAGLFAATQPTTIVPEAAYNSAYNANFPNTYASIQANTLTFTPIAPLNTKPCAPSPAPGCVELDQKAIQELFTLDYGRMNATLGVEIPLTNFQNQTTIPYGYVDWPTEIIQDGQTQLWKITHNGVDTHFIHFHLFNVQVVNRVGWDGSMRPPDANEMGWKDTVRMNPLEDILVALQPIRPILPWPLPDSTRPMDVTKPIGAADANISGLDPLSGNATISTVNNPVNFGWEYVWHCHILGHEENDMMRPIIFQVAPPAPTNLVGALGTPPNVVLTWTDNSASEDSFTLQRSTTTAFLPGDIGFASFPVNSTSANTSGFSTLGFGGTITFTDMTAVANSTYYYRVQANDSFTPVSPNPVPFQTVALSSAWSNIASATTQFLTPVVTFTGAPATAAYNSSFVVTATTNANVMPTITAAGVCTVSVESGTPATATATVTMTSGTGTCSLTASWVAASPFSAATAAQTTTATLATPVVSFTGAPVSAIYLSTFNVTATTNANVMPTIAPSGVCSIGPVGGTPTSTTATVTMTSGTGTCTLTAIWSATTNYAAASGSQTTIASRAAPTVSFTGAPASAVFSSQFNVTATTNANVMPTLAPTGVCSVGPVGGTPTNTTATVTMTSGTGTCGLTASWPATATYAAASLAQSTPATKLASTTSITSNSPNPSVVGQPVTVSVRVTGTGLTGPTGNFTVTGNGSTCTAALSAGVGSCPLTFVTTGVKTLTASYVGDSNYNTSLSSGVNQSVGDFSIGVSPASQTVNGGQSAKYTVTLTPVGGFTGAVSLSCSGVPSTYRCSITPTSVTLNGGTQRATVTVTTAKGSPGTYTLSLNGTNAYTGGSLVHTTTAGLTVKK
jgi:FtsP/CotA-like multicopper oxidase with cupredoxin domain